MGQSTDRERALDALRAIALVRVVLWHTYGNAAITYVVAAVPTMFFVTGSLFAKSAERRPVAEVVRNRVRRIFVPLWAFSAVCLLAMSVAHRVDGTVGNRRAVARHVAVVHAPRRSATVRRGRAGT